MPAPFPYKTQPWAQYQRDALMQSASRPAFFLAMPPGTGKTWVMINTAAFLFLTNKIDAMLVLAPNNVHLAWAAEQLPLHMPDTVPWHAVVWRSKRKPMMMRADVQLAINAGRDQFPIFCVNSETITTPRCTTAVTAFLKAKRCLFVVDESGDFTTPSAQRTRQLMRWRRLAAYRRCLDGTPVNTTPFDLYAPYRFLDPRILGYDNFQQMKDAHAEWEEFERERGVDAAGNRRTQMFKVVKVVNGRKQWKNLDVLAAKIAPHTYRITKEEALPDLPPKIYRKVLFELTEEQRRLTRELKSQLTTDLAGGGTATAMIVLTQYLRYQQISCGYIPPDIIYGEDETQPLHIIPGPNPRLDAALAEIQRCGTQATIIWTRFHFDIDLLTENLRDLNLKFVTYDARTSVEARERAKLAFQAGEVGLFLGNPAAGGRGLNLQVAEREIFYANYFGLRRRLQAEDRGHRIGTKGSLLITDVVGERSFDTVILRALRNNMELSDLITGDPTLDWI